LQSDSKAPGSPVFSCRTAGAKPSQSLAYSETTKAILDSSQKFFEDLLKRGDLERFDPEQFQVRKSPLDPVVPFEHEHDDEHEHD
jgi:hypothetical protein